MSSRPIFTRAENRPTCSVVSSLRARALRLNICSLLILLLIACALFFGIQLFATAEQSPTVPTTVREMSQALAASSSERSKLQLMLDVARQNPSVKAEVVSALLTKLKSLDIAHRSLEKQISRAVPLPAMNDTDEPLRYALTLLGGKIGAVTLVIFAVQILVRLFRYTAELASSCESRADLLQLLPADSLNETHVLTAALVPTDVKFDKERSHRLTAPNLTKAIVDLVSTSRNRKGS